MKKFFLIFIVLKSSVLFSQKSDFWNNVQFGGGFTLGLGNQTTIGISPSAIYNFENGFAVGTGVNYLYSEINDFTTTLYGGSIISLYQIPKIDIQLSADLEYHFANQKDLNGINFSSNFPALHFGIAYNQGRFAFGLRYDVFYDANTSVFASPISPVVRFYF